MSPVRLLPLLAAGACLLALPAAAGAAQRRAQPLVDAPPLGTAFKDRLVDSGPGIRARAAQAAKAYRAPDGTTVQVRFTEAYREDPIIAQTYVDFLGSLPHGDELSKLKLVLAPPAEVESECGGTEGVLACYDGRTHEMIVPGEQIQTESGVTTSYVITHEYGHHVASYRKNTPFRALDWGPKRWASYEMVCNLTLAGKLAPGDEGRFYRANPGESWAEVYARLKYPEEPWRFTQLLKPDPGALAVAAQDVGDPWDVATEQVFTGSFTGSDGDEERATFPLTLDGGLRVKLDGPARARYDLRISSLGKVRGRTKGKGAQDVIKWAAACRQRRTETVTVTVVRRAGTGPYKLTVTYAG